MNKKAALVMTLALTLVLSLAGCKSKEKDLKGLENLTEQQLWDKAKSSKDMDVYDYYLTKYSKGGHAGEAKNFLMEKWDKKVKSLTKEDMAKLTAVIETDKGVIKFKFFPEDAPNHCRNFIKLAQSHFYDTTIFHRVVPGFVIQGGDPMGTGMGGPGYNIDAEFNERPHLEGSVAMARARDPNSAGSQFYICLAPQPRLDRQYTVFGQVIEGMETVNAIGMAKTGARSRPIEDQAMNRVYIEGL